MAQLIIDAGTVLTGVLGYATDTITFIMATPILMIFAVFAIASFGIGVARSFIKGV